MYACAELFCVLTKVRNKFVFRRFLLRGGALVPSSPLRAPLGAHQVITLLTRFMLHQNPQYLTAYTVMTSCMNYSLNIAI